MFKHYQNFQTVFSLNLKVQLFCALSFNENRKFAKKIHVRIPRTGLIQLPFLLGLTSEKDFQKHFIFRNGNKC